MFSCASCYRTTETVTSTDGSKLPETPLKHSQDTGGASSRSEPLTAVVFALQDGRVVVLGRAAIGRGCAQCRRVVPLSLLHRTRLVTQDVHQRPEEEETRSDESAAMQRDRTFEQSSPRHVDVAVPGSARHLAEGDPDAHGHHHGEGDHASDHVGRAAPKTMR